MLSKNSRTVRGLLLRLTAFVLIGLSSLAAPADEKLKVVTTIPDLADFARRIGGPEVEVRSLSRGTENLHAVRVKPSMLIALSKADLFLEMGLSMESAWLPELLIKSRNKKIAVGADGFENCSLGWKAIDVPESLSRKEGELHPEGNPHFNLDPEAGLHLARRVHAALSRVDPEHEDGYNRRLAAWTKEYEAARKGWEKIGKELKGKKLAVYHVEFNYFATRYGMELAASIEPKPGIPPRPSDIAKVVKALGEKSVPLIVTAAWSNNRQVADIARKTNAKVLELPNQVGGADWAGSWVELMNGMHKRLAEAYGIKPEGDGK